MPTVFKIDGFRFFFFSDEHTPVHIHVEKGDGYMRVELQTLKITQKQNFKKSDEKKISKFQNFSDCMVRNFFFKVSKKMLKIKR